ncbi:Predicted DNA-binding transcriptional regulator YafY, contains an HTH and WYL domains [Amycolatopsis tolypomycina]|uniref:Predicted DNA-binding transcriptional regulator YafY, contains an HTH and WYL domains n=1 Tax=Amycolatopsis tolypomycina TaxID=208445 RepID=A0A1H4SAI0_9PSEU|nr:YafY family protein [Amycolatopsis tolypomycina]SEC40861.1 Predicted DNA-binding transcriptional regulator YafY, contains an HTH and WYL domains [Amycolatopsis tolypomycina]
MYGTAERLLRLLSLLQARRDWPGADLATRLEVDVRTIRRDVERLRSLGYPVHATPGVAGGYRLGAGAALPPLLLDDDEAVAVAVGLRTAASGTVGGMVGGIEETSVRALAKLEQVLPARLRSRVGALQAATVALPGAGPTVDAEVLTVLATACRDQERLRFGYAGSSGAATDRSVEPLRLVCTGRRWYLVAFDLDRAAWRTFRADRIDGVPVPGFRFTPREPPAADLAEYVARQISTEVYPHRLVLRVAAPATALAHRIPPTAGVVEEVDEHSCLLRTGASNLDAVPYYLAQLGYDFVVEEAPPGLVERLREVAERFARAVG